SSAALLSASKRITITGVVLDARARPKPSAYSTRTPSIVSTRSAPGKGFVACSFSTRACGSPSSSAQWISGVEGAFGRLFSAALYGVDELGEVLRLSRIGMVVREAPVDFAVELGDLAAEPPVEARGEHPGDAVAAVDGDLHRACELHVADDALDVGIEHIGL